MMLGGVLCAAVWLRAQTFTLGTGETITAEPLHFDNNGVVFKYPDGRTSARVPWTNFPEAALKQFADNPSARSFVAQYLDTPEDDSRKKKEITVKQPERLDRPVPKSTLGALFSSPLSIGLLALVYIANLYAALEIASFRNRRREVVCGMAAILPLVTPVLFLCLPTARDDYEPAVTPAPAPAHSPPPPSAPVHTPPARPAPAAHRPLQVHSAEPEPEPAHEPQPAPRPAPAAPRVPDPVVYQRGQTMFNRRFFETKLAGFLRMVPSDAEKDLIVVIKSARGEFVGNRISKLLPNELVLQFQKANASSDITVPFTEIQEVQVRHKDS